jgi:hypothetical protein
MFQSECTHDLIPILDCKDRLNKNEKEEEENNTKKETEEKERKNVVYCNFLHHP